MALFRTRNSSGAAPLDGVDVVLSDLDGVVYRGHEAIPHAVDSLGRAAQHAHVAYITNNASRTDVAVAEQLRGFGLAVEPHDVVTSPQAAVRLLAGLVPAGSRILVIGGDGLSSVVAANGFVVVDSADDEPAAVIQGFSQDLGWRELAEASFALAGGDDGIPWVATNTDWTLPLARGIAPGNGTLVSAVHTAVGRLPVVAGKPEVAIFEEARQRFGARNPLFIGDRLDTDVLGANRAGMPAVLVLTGIDKAKQLLAAGADSRPRYILEDLRGLHEPYPEVEKGRGGATVVGDAAVRIDGTTVEVAREGGDPLNLLRAACHAIWDSGIAIYALDVPERLYR